jgi:ATPase subunit of ABC transporter with duplicated ATPase domains
LERRIERLKAEMPTRTTESKGPTLKTIAPPNSGRVVLEAADLWKAYDQNIVLAGVSFTLERGQKLALLGPNGAGKTTLLKVIGGALPVDDGAVRPGLNVRLGYYAQEHEALDPSATVLEEAKRSAAIGQPVPPPPEGVVRSFLGSFLFTGAKVFQQVGTLSGGERTRLALAKLFLEKANLLLLDEPTNNLDPASQEALLKVLVAFTGTLVIVCHQAEFMERLAPDRALTLPEGQLAPFDPALLLPPSKRGRNGTIPGGVAAPVALSGGKNGRR